MLSTPYLLFFFTYFFANIKFTQMEKCGQDINDVCMSPHKHKLNFIPMQYFNNIHHQGKERINIKIGVKQAQKSYIHT